MATGAGWTETTVELAGAKLHLARAGSVSALGELLELYHGYLSLLARLQIGRRLQGKVDAGDLVQETFLGVHQHFAQFRGTTEAEFVCWLRRILASKLADILRRYCGTRRDVRLERELVDEQVVEVGAPGELYVVHLVEHGLRRGALLDGQRRDLRPLARNVAGRHDRL